MQVREGAAAAGVLLGGENALPCFVPGGVDQYALDRIVYNTKPWSPPLQVRLTTFHPAYCRTLLVFKLSPSLHLLASLLVQSRLEIMIAASTISTFPWLMMSLSIAEQVLFVVV